MPSRRRNVDFGFDHDDSEIGGFGPNGEPIGRGPGWRYVAPPEPPRQRRIPGHTRRMGREALEAVVRERNRRARLSRAAVRQEAARRRQAAMLAQLRADAQREPPTSPQVKAGVFLGGIVGGGLLARWLGRRGR